MSESLQLIIGLTGAFLFAGYVYWVIFKSLFGSK